MINSMDLLKEEIKSYKKAAVAFSGGVDSTFLLKICLDILGPENVLAITGVSETYTPGELEFTQQVAGEMGVRHIVLTTDELSDEDFAANTKLRCYYCKKNFFSKLKEIADKEKIQFIIDGTNYDDRDDYRPGRQAAEEIGILSPLLKAKISKKEIRLHSKLIGLKSWDKPSNPCLASRVPYGIQITKEKLAVIARAEDYMHKNGFINVRVRHHGSIARIELFKRDMPRFMDNDMLEKTNQYMKSLGFTWVALDIGGYRTGSLNEAILNSNNADKNT